MQAISDIITDDNMKDEDYRSPIEWDEEDTATLDRVKLRVTNLRRIFDEGLLEDFTEDEWKMLMRDGLHAVEYNPRRTWEETVKIMEYFKSQGALVSESVRAESYRVSETFQEHYTPERRHRCDFMYSKLKWLLENGADPNAYDEDCTALDYFLGDEAEFWGGLFLERDSTYLTNMRAKIVKLLKEHGARKMWETTDLRPPEEAK